MASRIFALIIWAAVAASLAYWGLRWLARPAGVPPNATSVSLNDGTQGDLRRLLSGPAKAGGQVVDQSAASALASRLKLLGVVASRHEGDGTGVALLSIDDKPPRAVKVGGVVEGDMVIQSLTQHGASIGPANGPATLTLDLPPLPDATTGSLPPVSGFSTDSAQPGMAPPPGSMSEQDAAQRALGSAL
jgi:general secretion pathway protein C